KQRTPKITRIEVAEKNFLEKKAKAIRVFVTNHKDLNEISSKVAKLPGVICRREHDIPLIQKYIKEKKVNPLRWHTVDAEPIGEEDFAGFPKIVKTELVLKAKKIESTEKSDFEPKILAFDIETESQEVGNGKILLISIYSKNFRKVLTWKFKSKKSFVESFESEKEMVKAFSDIVCQQKPDILTGYFSDGFDIPYLISAAKRLKVPLFLGPIKNPPQIVRGNPISAKIPGLVHIDTFKFIRNVFSQYLQSETLSLNEVAKELLGMEKKEFDFSKISSMNYEDWEKFAEYNLHDSKLSYELLRKIWQDIKEFCLIVKDPLFDTTRNSMSSNVESYIIQNLDKFNEIAEKRPTPEEITKRRAKGRYAGAFVFEPTPGIYENLVMFDFTSMYASVIVAYNLSKSTYLGNKKFSKKPGFFPRLLKEIIELRKKHKKEYAKNQSPLLKARSNAYKLLANASYGYQGFFAARYYCFEAAAATARLARENLKKTMEKIKKEGYKIIYSDTDSIAFLRGKKSKKEVIQLLKRINSELPEAMELDLEDFYMRGLFVHKRTTKSGAKKKYALLSEEGKLKIRGFETVRRDWCMLARRLQSDIIEKILKTGNEKKALLLLKETIKKLREGKIQKNELIIKTQLKKPIDSYQSKGPHVIAAEKMKKSGTKVFAGSIIEYFVGKTKEKRKKIGEAVFLPEENADYDPSYYLNNQVLPAVENIFDIFGINIKEIIEGKKQTSLLDFK
ncbi:hypothetical protein D6829_02320, partial [Candidatus Pacearchaeota archaeon]